VNFKWYTKPLKQQLVNPFLGENLEFKPQKF